MDRIKSRDLFLSGDYDYDDIPWAILPGLQEIFLITLYSFIFTFIIFQFHFFIYCFFESPLKLNCSISCFPKCIFRRGFLFKLSEIIHQSSESAHNNIPGVTNNFSKTCDRVNCSFKSVYLYLGTNWCGYGHITPKGNGSELGTYVNVDKCCRTHDHCPR